MTDLVSLIFGKYVTTEVYIRKDFDSKGVRFCEVTVVDTYDPHASEGQEEPYHEVTRSSFKIYGLTESSLQVEHIDFT
jgi:hypothetical protein